MAFLESLSSPNFLYNLSVSSIASIAELAFLLATETLPVSNCPLLLFSFFLNSDLSSNATAFCSKAAKSSSFLFLEISFEKMTDSVEPS